jgi:uncharacterized protein (DUF3084 family)
VPVVAVAVALAVFASCNQGPSPEELARDKALQENARLTAELQSRDSLISGMALSVDDIERNIALMDEQGKLINENLSASDQKLDKRQKIVRDIQLMNGLLKESREKVADLDKRLSRSKGETASLRKKLKDIDMQLAMRDSMLLTVKDQLVAKDFQIGQINDQLTAIELEVAKREAVILQQENEINKAYMATGTFKELEQEGVLTKDGGLAGIGKHVALNEEAATSKFRQVDVRELRKVPLNVQKATVITEHPKGSYQIVEENDEMAYLEIKDPDQFWRLSKYLVVEVK